MKIFGLQKLTLLDFPGHVACTVFTGGCNFRCPFCHNSPLVVSIAEQESYDESEILDFLEKRRGILDGVAVSGGEPLLAPRLDEFLVKIRGMGYAVKLDTNGSLPDRLVSLVERGLVDHVAMDVKNSLEKYPLTVGVENFDTAPIRESIRYLLSGKVSYEFRTTVVKQFHTEDDFRSIGPLIQGAEHYYLQQFTDKGNNIVADLDACSPEQMMVFRDIVKPYVPNVALRGI